MLTASRTINVAKEALDEITQQVSVKLRHQAEQSYKIPDSLAGAAGPDWESLTGGDLRFQPTL
ncbi:hypothetical protein H1235_03675 [Pseudoxanthomonas sp. NC8]|nr:hypothetical protein H1235_03675 [Pseudoxanthomonas sp. NC8]